MAESKGIYHLTVHLIFSRYTKYCS